VKALTGVEIDESGKDVGRLCFLSYDPEIYVNDGATEITPLPPEPKRPAQTNVADLPLRQRIAVELLGAIDWQSETSGFLDCPAKKLHTTGDGKRDCKIELDGAPTIHCFHNSCRGILDGVNHELRSRIGKAENADKARLSDKSENANAEDETIRRLAEMSLLEYEKARKDAAKELGCRPSILDSLVNAKRLLMRPLGENDLQGVPVKLADIQLWPEPVNGAEVLDAVADTFSRYAVLPEGAADALALWCPHTHVFDLFQCSPRLNISSPEKQCGKTTLRDVAALFVPRPVIAENLTTAVLFRLASAQHPVILADECDTWLVENEKLRSLFNSGHRKGGVVMRCEGENNEVRAFSCYAPAMLCGIGELSATLHDRSIVIRLERAKPREIEARFDSRHVEYENELNRKLARWCNDNRGRIEACDPQLPANAFNRLADNWRPLFAVAEVAGGDWPQRCASAFAKLTHDDADADGLRIMLLTDIREIFKEERMFSKDLVERLAELKERPWPEVCRGKPITERWLARNLAAFGIHPKLIRIGEDKPARGYEKDDFRDKFERYLSQKGDLSVTPLQYEGKQGFSKCYKSKSVTDEKTTPYIGKCNGVTDKKPQKPPCDEFLAEGTSVL
jgi:putative DNA primase/helicase